MTALRTLMSNRKAAVGVVIMAFFVLMATVGPFLVDDASNYVDLPLLPPSGDHWLGTTGLGQDVLAQTVVGARVTLAVGFATGFLVVGIGALVGGIAGYFRGWVDDVLTVVVNVFLVLPGLPLMVVLAAVLPPGPLSILGVLVLTGWAWNARVLRSQVLSLRRRDFIEAARVSGEPALRIIVVEILPNMASLLASSFIGTTVYAIGAQVGLEFLGLGDVSAVTWGTNLYWAANDVALLTGSWWTFVPTGVCVALVGFALTLINFGLDELTNPRLTARKGVLVPGQPPGPTPLLEGLDG